MSGSLNAALNEGGKSQTDPRVLAEVYIVNSMVNRGTLRAESQIVPPTANYLEDRLKMDKDLAYIHAKLAYETVKKSSPSLLRN